MQHNKDPSGAKGLHLKLQVWRRTELTWQKGVAKERPILITEAPVNGEAWAAELKSTYIWGAYVDEE